MTEGDRQRLSIVDLRHRPRWQELLPHLQQLGIRVGLAEELPIFDLTAAEWMYKRRGTTTFEEALSKWMLNRRAVTEVPMSDEFRMTLRKPFPERRRDVYFRSMDHAGRAIPVQEIHGMPVLGLGGCVAIRGGRDINEIDVRRRLFRTSCSQKMAGGRQEEYYHGTAPESTSLSLLALGLGAVGILRFCRHIRMAGRRRH